MYEYKATMVKIVDGDTVDVSIDLGFDIQYNSRVRLYGINTPESRTRDLEEKKKGLAAKARVEELVPIGSSVILSTQKDGNGKFGRILGMIFKDIYAEDSINQMLVAEGHAVIMMAAKDELTLYL